MFTCNVGCTQCWLSAMIVLFALATALNVHQLHLPIAGQANICWEGFRHSNGLHSWWSVYSGESLAHTVGEHVGKEFGGKLMFNLAFV